MNIKFYQSRKIYLFNVFAALASLIFCLYFFRGLENEEEVIRKFLLIGALVFICLITIGMTQNIYYLIYPELGVSFDEEGIKSETEEFSKIEWSEIKDMEIGRKNVLYIKLNSTKEYLKRNDFFYGKIIRVMDYFGKEFIEEETEVEINLKDLTIKDEKSFKEQLESMKEQYL